MRTAIFLWMTLVCVGCAIAQNPPAANKTLSADSSVDDVLDALKSRGDGLKDFSADISMTVISQDTGDEYTQLGKVWYQIAADDQARLRVTLDKKKVDNKVINETIEYLLEGPWLTDRNYRIAIETKRQVLKPGEKFSLFNLSQGGLFPLPIGQDKTEVYKLFDVNKIATAKDDPADTIHIQLVPKKDSRFARKLKSIDVWVTFTDHMPRRIDVLDANGDKLRSTLLENVKVNANLTDADFKLPPINDKDWTRHEELYEE